jgi:hypothetical protein
MQAYKFKGKIDSSGNLLITETVNLPPCDVEVIVWQAANPLDDQAILANEPLLETPKKKSRVKAFDGLFENAPPVPSDFQPDGAKWEYLKEKHNL